MITKALLGTSPITSVTYVLSMFTPYTIGQWTILLNLLFIAADPLMMTRRELRSDLRVYLLQIPITFCFGSFIDVSMGLLDWVEPAGYASQLAYLCVGCVILAAGITLEVKANIALVAGEYLVRTISRRFKWDFGYTKLGLDVSLLLLSCAVSLVFMSAIKGVREGTLVAALTVGPIVHFLTPFCRVLDGWLGEGLGEGKAEARQAAHAVITIAREYGSGGHRLGEMLTRELGIRLYDGELISMAASRSGMDERYITANEQSIPSFWLKCIVSEKGPDGVGGRLSPDDLLFITQCKVIEDAAASGPCVIVGRCGDFVLRDNPCVLRVFCYTDPADAHRRSVEEYGLGEAEADGEIRRVNRRRKTHYEYYTGEKWSDPHRYDLVVNTGTMGLETACSLIKEAFKSKQAAAKARK